MLLYCDDVLLFLFFANGFANPFDKGYGYRQLCEY